MCVRCGTGRVAWCTDPYRHGDDDLGTAPAPGASVRKCCGLPMNTLDLFGVRLYRCMYRGHHPLVFRNLSTGEEATETYRDGDGGMEWTSHYGEG